MPYTVRPVLPHFGPMPALGSHPVSSAPHSPTQKSHPALPTPSTPAYRQQDQSHQECSHYYFTSWKNRTPKCRYRQNQGAEGLAPPGSHQNLGSGPSPGSTSPLSTHRGYPHQCPPRSSCQGLFHFYQNIFCSGTSQVMLKREKPTQARSGSRCAVLHQ